MTTPLSLIARIHEGSPSLSQGQRDRLSRFYKEREEKYIYITVSEKGKPRSLNQNAYYHAEFVERCAQHDGNKHLDMHEILKWEFLEHRIIHHKGEIIEVAKSTKYLTSLEFTEFLDKIAAEYGSSYGMRFMTPEEWYASRIDNEIL